MKIMFVSLGCDKNLVDTEKMLGLLQQKGHTFTDDETEAEVIVVNSCCFIGDAKEESIQTIIEMGRMKEEGNCKLLLVTGCLAQRYQDELLKELPEADGILGTNSWQDIVDLVEEAEKKQTKPEIFHDLREMPRSEAGRVVTTGGYYAYLKIAEGCDKHCTYCIIPKVRGDFRSVPMEDLLKEARDLADSGVRELILVAQETTVYGTDLYGKKSLPELLHRLAEIPGLYWIRILYCYPEEITDELIQTIKAEPKVCDYLDIPIQHCSDRILGRMGRKTSEADLRRIIGTLREEIPDIALRTTLITGFPGETEEDHEKMMAFVNEMEFTRLGVFTYSPEEGTPAAEMPDQVPEETKEQWRDEIMELQQEVSYDLGQEMIGKELTVMIEGKVADEAAYVARTYMDAPGVDGYLFVQTGEALMSGDFVRVRVTGAEEYDLIGELIL
ncbi:MAG: 30S ribosomal protein S12 methylthiotransferase RimO [Lachnospiraceae bacterium]|nr:30S ribosomal protein S12 methylthiotransferase RimO [Cuneatibacter sp.]MDD6455769.1 30S ribosomal protein S12 methylthiotransferase RimO [Lachnospiraceae bacterium]